ANQPGSDLESLHRVVHQEASSLPGPEPGPLESPGHPTEISLELDANFGCVQALETAEPPTADDPVIALGRPLISAAGDDFHGPDENRPGIVRATRKTVPVYGLEDFEIRIEIQKAAMIPARSAQRRVPPGPAMGVNTRQWPVLVRRGSRGSSRP